MRVGPAHGGPATGERVGEGAVAEPGERSPQDPLRATARYTPTRLLKNLSNF